MIAFESHAESVVGRRWDDGAAAAQHNREGLALLMLDRILTVEGSEPEQFTRAYLLDLLREILLTIDGKRPPPIVIPSVDRRHG